MTNTHYEHKVLGSYCWDCKAKTASGIPDWDKPRKNDGPKTLLDRIPTSIVWADGSVNAESDNYREIGTIKSLEENNNANESNNNE